MLDRQHPATEGAAADADAARTAGINWDPNPVGTVHTLAQVEERFYDPGPGANGPFHPVSWCRDYDGGRSFYTGMGHTEASYAEAGLPQPPRRRAALDHRPGARRLPGHHRRQLPGRTADRGQPARPARPDRRAARPDHRRRTAPSSTSARRACPTGPVVDWADPNVGPRLRHHPLLRPGDQAGQAAHHAAGDGQPGQRLRAGQERGGPARHRARPGLRHQRLALRLLDAARVDRPGEADRPADRLPVHLRQGDRGRSTRPPARTC